MRKIIATTVLGNVVEYYDFGIYAVFAPIMGEAFFPSSSKFTETLLVFTIFAIGFLMRPVGGLIFGYIGDIFGRKIALKISIIGMAISTLVVGILPTYDSIGMFAPIILTLARLFQGLCIGGEGTGSAIFILEHTYNKNIGITGSMVMAANVFGTFLANIVGVVISNTIGLNSFTWRYGFILGAILGIIGAYFRNISSESPVFSDMQQNNKNKLPLVDIVKHKKYAVILVVAVAAVATSLSYLIRGYINTFFSTILSYSYNASICFTLLSLGLVIIFMPIFGYIAHKVGQSRFLIITSLIIIFSIIPVFSFIVSKNLLMVYIGLFGMSILCAAISAPAYPYALRSFPPLLRYSGVALGWNIGNAIFGGTTPFIATILVHNYGYYGPSYYIISTALLFVLVNFILALIIRNVKQKNKLRMKLDVI